MNIFQDADAVAAAILRDVGPRIVLALPLGLGKANTVANALYRLAANNPAIDLQIFTALTLEKPAPHTELERRFLQPISERLFAGYPDLLYAQGLRSGTLPPNIRVHEFFFLAGAWLGNPRAQQNYMSANYTHAARYIIEHGVNVIAQLVAQRSTGTETRYSLACNTDMTLDLLQLRASGGAAFKLVGEVNSELPFMSGEADVPAATFSHMLDSPATDFALFAPPKEAVNFGEYATGLHVARLVPDGGTLQIGIGQEADAVARGLILRHHDNDAFREAIARLAPEEPAHAIHEDGAFAAGLHGLSEMFVDTFLALIDAGILTREVNGALLHAAFFLGPRDFYRRLREMPEDMRARLRMTGVSFTNELYGDEAAKRPSRVGARFINGGMIATLLGAVVSDGLAGGHVVSGVGGQYNFVSQAFALPDARAIITLKATRTARGKVTSNIRASYSYETIPRHLRDIIVTEYGLADIRGKSDRDVVAAMLAIADSRFQPELLKAAKDAGKIEKSFELPTAARDNTPERISRALTPLAERGLIPPYPFGTDFTAPEQRLIPALEALKEAAASPTALARFILHGRPWMPLREDGLACLARLGLDKPSNATEYVYGILVRAALNVTAGT